MKDNILSLFVCFLLICQAVGTSKSVPSIETDEKVLSSYFVEPLSEEFLWERMKELNDTFQEAVGANTEKLNSILERLDAISEAITKLQTNQDKLEVEQNERLGTVLTELNYTSDVVLGKRMNVLNEKLEKIDENLKLFGKFDARVDELQATTHQVLKSWLTSMEKIEEVPKISSVFNECSNILKSEFEDFTQKLNQFVQVESKVDGLQENSKQLLNSLNGSTEKLENLFQRVSELEKCDVNAVQSEIEKLNGKLDRFDKAEAKIDGLQANSVQLLDALTKSTDKIGTLYQFLNESESNPERQCVLKNAKEIIDLHLNEFLKTNEANFDLLKSNIANLDSRINDIDANTKINREELASISARYLPHSCQEALNGSKSNGIYRLSLPSGNMEVFNAYCFRDADSGVPWTMIMLRRDDTVNFARDWDSYKTGFGDISGDHWLGLERIYALTNKERHELWILQKTKSGYKYEAFYDNFLIGDDKEKYKIKSLGTFESTADDILEYCSNAEFYTYNTDIDPITSKDGGSGFWNPKKCFNLNGQTADSGKFHIKAKLNDEPVVYVHMAIRPK